MKYSRPTHGGTFAPALAALVAYLAMWLLIDVSDLGRAVNFLAGAVAFVLTLLVRQIDHLQRRIDALERDGR